VRGEIRFADTVMVHFVDTLEGDFAASQLTFKFLIWVCVGGVIAAVALRTLRGV
jgi:uncharacterized membrane protein